MLKKLKIRVTLTVEALRADRSLNLKITGEISADLSGDVSGLWGDVSRLSGNVDECEISDEEREAGLDIASLVEDVA